MHSSTFENDLIKTAIWPRNIKFWRSLINWLSSLYLLVKNEFSISCFEISFPLSKIFSFLTLDMSHSYRNDPRVFNNHRGEKASKDKLSGTCAWQILKRVAVLCPSSHFFHISLFIHLEIGNRGYLSGKWRRRCTKSWRIAAVEPRDFTRSEQKENVNFYKVSRTFVLTTSPFQGGPSLIASGFPVD